MKSREWYKTFDSEEFGRIIILANSNIISLLFNKPGTTDILYTDHVMNTGNHAMDFVHSVSIEQLETAVRGAMQ